MRLCGFVLLITAIKAGAEQKLCDTLKTDKYCFDSDTLVTMPHSPNQLAVDKLSNTLYFSFDVGKGDYIPAILNMETKALTVLKGVKDAFALAANNDTDDIYFGGSHGVYKYNARVKSLQRLNFSNLDIWWLFIMKEIYFIKFPSLGAFYYKNKTIIPVPELKDCMVHQFVMDMDRDIFFLNGSGLYMTEAGKNAPSLIQKHPRFIGIATDNNGFVHVCNENGIFIIKKITKKVIKVVDTKGVLGIAFDSANNIIYSNSHEIIKLIPSAHFSSVNFVDY